MSGNKASPLGANADAQDSSRTQHSRSSRFRFKSKHTRSASEHDFDPSSRNPSKRRCRTSSPDSLNSNLDTPREDVDTRTSHHRRHHRHHHHRTHRHNATSTTPPLQPDPAPHDADLAFRESLFDALADDEGAAYWEGVYGQPIHTYTYPATSSGPGGDLERMTDDEYVTYVRARMWEKSHEHVVEERARRERERFKQKEKEKVGAEFQARMEASLRRGEERRRAGTWRVAWEGYERAWSELKKGVVSGGGDGGEAGVGRGLKDRRIWPVKSGKAEDVGSEAIEAFFRHAPLPREGDVEGVAGDEKLRRILKAERVRWHPDKMQQRFGGGGIGKDGELDVETMGRVTAVFQCVDALWGTLK